jgi:hypothetical protein
MTKGSYIYVLLNTWNVISILYSHYSVFPKGTRQLSRTNYAVGVLPAPGYCGIEWTQDPRDPYSFTVSDDTASIGVEQLGMYSVEAWADHTKPFLVYLDSFIFLLKTFVIMQGSCSITYGITQGPIYCLLYKYITTSLSDTHLQSQLLLFIDTSFSYFTTCFGPTGHPQVNHKLLFTTLSRRHRYPNGSVVFKPFYNKITIK